MGTTEHAPLADELLQAAASLLDDPIMRGLRGEPVQRLRTVVDALRPADPPTLAEALAALELSAKWANLNVDNLDEDDRKECDRAESNACAILKRARRAGLL